MSETKQTVDLNVLELVNLAANILDQLFIKAPKDQAKSLFKAVKQGKSHPLGTITIQEMIKPTLDLALDYSEFKGPGFNYDAFESALRSILHQISIKFKKRDDLNILSNDQGSMVIHLPGVIQINQQFNVMVMAFEMDDMTSITLRLMFVDPDQYEALQSKP